MYLFKYTHHTNPLRSRPEAAQYAHILFCACNSVCVVLTVDYTIIVENFERKNAEKFPITYFSVLEVEHEIVFKEFCIQKYIEHKHAFILKQNPSKIK